MFLHQKLRERRTTNPIIETNKNPGYLPSSVFKEIAKYSEGSSQIEVLNLSLNDLKLGQSFELVKVLPP